MLFTDLKICLLTEKKMFAQQSTETSQKSSLYNKKTANLYLKTFVQARLNVKI
jgi:hypothetical protein